MKVQYMRLALIVAGLFSVMGVKAYDFVVNGIYYHVISPSDREVGVTFKDNLKGSYSGDVVVPSKVVYERQTYKVTDILVDAFRSSYGLTSVTIPDEVTTIEGGTFEDCIRLTSVKLPKGLTSIPGSMFKGCEALTSVTIPDKVTSIIGHAFNGCYKLTSITLPKGVTSIGGDAFYQCTGLTSIMLSAELTTIGSTAFGYCDKLASITIPEKVTTIEGRAFASCKSLTSIIIPNNVTYIGYNAFFSCWSLTSVTIGRSVNTIGDNAFDYCTGLKKIYSLNPTPPTLGRTIFEDVDTSKCTLYVPKGSKAAYKASPWGEFNLMMEETTGIHTPLSDHILINSTGSGLDIEAKEPVNVAVYTPSGQLLWHETVDGYRQVSLGKGMYIVKAGSGSGKVVVE